jgi:diguanylate cyclase (GGDEF)-like protein
MEDILQRCVELDEAAHQTYAELAERCEEAELKRTFERMGIEESAHVIWWRELRDAHAAGLVPPPLDEQSLRESILEAESQVKELLAERELSELTSNEMLELAVRMEFFMLDPAFGELIEMLDPGLTHSHREAYSRHVLRLVHAIEDRREHGGISAFLARVLARAFHNQERLATLATHDPLTGLLNRRGFYSHLAQSCSWAQRYDHSIGVLMIDVDHFKQVNDTFGHPAGDEVLRRIAVALGDSVRTSDLVGRYGGEEFTVLAPETSAEALESLAQRVLDGVRTRRFIDQAPDLPITVSVGSAFVEGGVHITPEALLSSADRSLYEAKESGRDRAGTTINAAEKGSEGA